MKSKPVSSSAPVAVVVDDDPTQLTILAGLLTKAGLNPHAFSGAEAALSYMTANTGILPALIVTDLYMPGIDGWRFCRLLRSPEYAALNHVPILVVSATFVGDEPNRIATDLGAETFLSSPVNSKLFAEKVHAILSKNKIQNSLRVLIVEDSKILAGMLQKGFADNCYEADTAFAFQTAAEAFAKKIYDVAVLDYHLPDGSGDKLLDKFRAAQPDCVCLMMTTDEAPGLALDWMKRGAAAYLRKPFKPEYLIELCANARRERGLLRVQDLLELRTRELRESEAKYRRMADTANEGIIALDGDYKMTFINQQMASMLGYTIEEMLGQKLEIFIPEDQLADHHNQMKNRRQGENAVYERCFLKKDGGDLWVLISARAIIDSEGKFTGAFGMFTDITERKHAEEALRNSEERFRSVIDSLSDTIFIIDRNGKLTYESPAAARILGYSAGYFIGKSPFTHIHPDDLSRVVKDLDEVFESVNPGTMTEFRYRKADGTWINLEATGNNQIENQGIQGIVLTVRDISERKRAQDTLRESEEKYRLIFENSPLGLLYFDEKGVIIDCNEKFVQIIGSSREALIGLNMLKLPDKNIVSTVQKALRGSIGLYEGIYSSTTAKKITPMRNIFAPMTSGSGIVLGGLGIIEDITERKRVEDALRDSDERYRKAFMTSPDAIFITRFPDGMFVSVNSGFTKMTGYTEDEIIGKLPLEIDIWKYPEERKKVIEEFLTRGEVQNFESSFLTKSGEVTGLLSVSRVDLNGVQHNLCIARDITKHKTLEAQLQQAQKMESIGRLAGGVAHDFNNMLSVILGYSELAIRKAGADNPLHRHLAQILDAARRSAALTRQLLAFARQQTIAPIVIDLNKTIESMLKMLQRLIGEDIELQWHPNADLWPVKVDPSQIDQILANLCINARDAISDVGKITIETENSTLDNDYCANHAGFVPGDYLKLTVSDDGYGMAKEVQAKLFEPFFTTKEMGKGTGLGLATVYGIVKQNNGFINVYSEQGHGTSFTIYLLRHTANTLQTRPADPPAAAARGHETILLVEDEPAILEMAKTMLEGQGYSVRAAETPGEAMRLAREHSGEIDLLVTDVVMPEMNGRDLAKNIMSLYPNIKRLFMSGYTANVIAHHGVLDEGVYFIQKPFSINDLSAKVRETLDGNENPL